MKKILLAVLCIAAVLVSFASCAKDDFNGIDDFDDLFEIKSYPDGYPTKEDIVKAYLETSEAFGWISMTTLPKLDTEKSVDVDGLTYYKVDSKYLKSLDALEDYYESLMDEETTDILMEVNDEIHRFVERKDGLYCLSFSYEPKGFSEDKSYAVKKITDTSYQLDVAYQLVNEDGKVRGDRIQTYRYEKIDGEWIFVDFRLFRQ